MGGHVLQEDMSYGQTCILEDMSCTRTCLMRGHVLQEMSYSKTSWGWKCLT